MCESVSVSYLLILLFIFFYYYYCLLQYDCPLAAVTKKFAHLRDN